MSSILIHILRFLFCFAAQILIFNNIELNRLLNPQIFIYCILFLPLHMNRHLLLLIAFISGLAMDAFCNTAGMHTIACTFLAFLRPWLISFIHREPEEIFKTQRFYHLSMSTTGTYLLACSALYHMTLASLEAFTFTGIFLSLSTGLISAITASIVLLIFRYAFAWFGSDARFN